MPRVPPSPQRSYIMSRIRSKDTKPELLLRKALWAQGIRYRTHSKDLPGRPDVVIKKYRLAIFIDGEFWHGHQWEKTKGRIRSNKDFWVAKIERNMARDKENNEALIAMGYTVFRFWGEDIRKNLRQCVNQIQLYIEAAGEGRVPYPADY
ncbi:very short patch repair endonuclease [Parapedobacter tibetensis]|uniref:very short patch repair endonuclease n=1 Tax=Parapedobacter tibetensis TaxID=2972951 RepID=UPI00214D9AE8|nr:very short patch repair endonuclease [Parapedobacter tibetensis]